MSNLSDWILKQLDRKDLTQETWYPANPRDQKSRKKLFDIHDHSNPLDEQAIDEWVEFLKPYNPPKEVLKNIELLKKENAAVVATGQQPGLLGGPFYSVSKAISAAHWAEKISADTGRPVVPVFWVASDDHDFAEVAITWLANGDQKAVSVSIPEDEKLKGHSVSEYEFTESVIAGLKKKVLENTYRPEHREAIEGLLNEILATPSPVTFETQFVALMLKWLGPLGVVPVVPSLPFLRRRTLDLFRREMKKGTELSEALVSQNEKLTKAISQDMGTESDAVGIHRKGNELNFFWHRPEGRCRLELVGEAVEVHAPAIDGPVEILSKNKLLQKIEKDCLDLSPNAALRPLVQDSALPNLATIGGFGELGYHAQIADLYHRLDIKRPLLIPRAEFLIIPPRLERFLKKTGLDAKDISLARRDELTRDLMQRFETGGLQSEVENHIGRIQTVLGELETVLMKAEDPHFERIINKIDRYVSGGQEKIEQRLQNTFSDRKLSAETSWNNVWELLFPEGIPQERAFSTFALLMSCNGPEAVGHLANAFDGTVYGLVHQVLLSELSAGN